MADSSKQSTFFGGAAILTITTLIVKVIGAIYRIPLGNILSDEAMADYNSAYNIYNVFFTISTVGLPVALSKCISEATALKRDAMAKKTFRIAFVTFLILGLIGFFCMTVLSDPISEYLLNNPKAKYCVMALAPSLLAVCIVSAFRGFFQGHFDMLPTGISQVIEALCKLLIGLALAIYIINFLGLPEMGSVGAIIGVSCGSVAALVYMIILYFRRQKANLYVSDRPDNAISSSSGKIAARLFSLAIPITISAAATSLVTLIDGNLVMGQLQSVYTTVDGQAAEAALDSARGLYGIYSKTLSIYNLPSALMMPLTACIVPAVSASLSMKEGNEARKISESALRVGALFALPMGLGLFALGEPIMGLLYPNIDTSIAGPLLSILGLAVIFVCLQLLCNSILQANGVVWLPILAVIAGGVVKIIVNYTLVGNPNIRINGAPIGTLCCFFIIAIIEMIFIRWRVKARPHFLRAFIKPIIASVIMAAVAWVSWYLLSGVIGSGLAVICAIIIAVIVYAVLIVVLRIISKEDLSLMPGGDRIGKILHIN